MRRFRRFLAVTAAIFGILAVTAPRERSTSTHAPDGYRWDFHPTVSAQSLGPSSCSTSGLCLLPARTIIGDYYNEHPSNQAAFLVRRVGINTMIHVDGGISTGANAIGARNNLGADTLGVSQAGIGMVIYGSAIGGTVSGVSRNNLAWFASEGPLSSGAMFGTGQQGAVGPAYIVTSDVNGAYLKAMFYHGETALTDEVSTPVADVEIPVGSVTGGTMDYFFYVVSAGGYQAVSGTLWFVATNAAGTETCTVGNSAGVDLIGISSVSAGTLSGSFGCTTGLTNIVRITLTANTSLTPVLFGFRWTGYKLAGPGTFIAK